MLFIILSTCHIENNMMGAKCFRKTIYNSYPDYFVQLRSAFQTPTDLFLELEYMSGGDCLSLLTSSPGGLPESVAVGIVSQVCIALQHLHIHGVIHR